MRTLRIFSTAEQIWTQMRPMLFSPTTWLISSRIVRPQLDWKSVLLERRRFLSGNVPTRFRWFIALIFFTSMCLEPIVFFNFLGAKIPRKRSSLIRLMHLESLEWISNFTLMKITRIWSISQGRSYSFHWINTISSPTLDTGNFLNMKVVLEEPMNGTNLQVVSCWATPTEDINGKSHLSTSIIVFCRWGWFWVLRWFLYNTDRITNWNEHQQERPRLGSPLAISCFQVRQRLASLISYQW